MKAATGRMNTFFMLPATELDLGGIRDPEPRKSCSTISYKIRKPLPAGEVGEGSLGKKKIEEKEEENKKGAITRAFQKRC